MLLLVHQNHRCEAPERYNFSECSGNNRGKLQMKITSSICFTQMLSQGMKAQYNRNTAVDLARSVQEILQEATYPESAVSQSKGAINIKWEMAIFELGLSRLCLACVIFFSYDNSANLMNIDSPSP